MVLRGSDGVRSGLLRYWQQLGNNMGKHCMGKVDSSNREFWGVCRDTGLCEETDCAETSNGGKVSATVSFMECVMLAVSVVV